jgi:hypothetical protein
MSDIIIYVASNAKIWPNVAQCPIFYVAQDLKSTPILSDIHADLIEDAKFHGRYLHR